MSQGVNPPEWVEINGVRYGSHIEAAKALGVTREAVSRLVKRKGTRVVSDYEPCAPRRPRECEFDGVRYHSIAEAARANGVDPNKMRVIAEYPANDRL